MGCDFVRFHLIIILKQYAVYNMIWYKSVRFNSFGIKYVPREVLNKIRDKSVTHNTIRMQDDGFIMGGFYCIACREIFVKSFLY